MRGFHHLHFVDVVRDFANVRLLLVHLRVRESDWASRPAAREGQPPTRSADLLDDVHDPRGVARAVHGLGEPGMQSAVVSDSVCVCVCVCVCVRIFISE